MSQHPSSRSGAPAARLLRPLLALALLAAARPDSAGAQTSSPSVTLRPAEPVQGTLVVITVRGAMPTADPPAATFAGEPIHLERRRDGTLRALGAVPVDAQDSLALVLGAGRPDSVVRWVPVRQGTWKHEKLRVAPRFGQEPDSALAARMADETRRAYEVGRRSHGTPRLWEDGFVRPRPSRVTSGFGRGREYNGQVTGRHMGTDFAGAVGTPVRATNRGVVALVDTFHLGGRVVYVDHGAGLVSAYMHLSRADVQIGDTVAKGQVIGRVGATGRVTGPHLHWVVRYGTTTVDPLSLPGLAAPPDAPRRRRAASPAG